MAGIVPLSSSVGSENMTTVYVESGCMPVAVIPTVWFVNARSVPSAETVAESDAVAEGPKTI